MDKKMLADALIVLSLLIAVLAAVTVFTSDLWLASSQWLLIAILLAVYGCYLRLRN
jgi:fatty acid desaturase